MKKFEEMKICSTEKNNCQHEGKHDLNTILKIVLSKLPQDSNECVHLHLFENHYQDVLPVPYAHLFLLLCLP